MSVEERVYIKKPTKGNRHANDGRTGWQRTRRINPRGGGGVGGVRN